MRLWAPELPIARGMGLAPSKGDEPDARHISGLSDAGPDADAYAARAPRLQLGIGVRRVVPRGQGCGLFRAGPGALRGLSLSREPQVGA